MTKKIEVSGNVLATQANIERHMARLAGSVHKADALMRGELGAAPHIRGIKFKAPTVDHGVWFVVVQAYIEDAPVVAFHSGSSFVEALEGTCNRLLNSSLKWKEDMYG